MKTKRLMVIGSGLALTLALGTGLATAQTTTSGGSRPPAATTTQMGDHNTMHEQMRGQMPAGQQARCDAQHARMGNGHGGMMMGGGSGEMGGGSAGMGMDTARA